MTNYIFLDNGFEEIEAITTIDLLRRANVPVTTVSVCGSDMVTGSHNIAVKADAKIDDLAFDDVQMLILPGGATHLENCQKLCDLLLAHNAKGGLIAAICAAPMVLGKLGILEGKQATCYPGCEGPLGEAFCGGLVVESANIITAKGPGLSSDFAFCLIEHLASPEIADEVYDKAQY